MGYSMARPSSSSSSQAQEREKNTLSHVLLGGVGNSDIVFGHFQQAETSFKSVFSMEQTASRYLYFKTVLSITHSLLPTVVEQVVILLLAAPLCMNK
jgi:hypothetical protein